MLRYDGRLQSAACKRIHQRLPPRRRPVQAALCLATCVYRGRARISETNCKTARVATTLPSSFVGGTAAISFATGSHRYSN